MKARRPLIAMFLILGAGYLGYPYVTLYRIDLAVKHADAATLRSLVDWYSVREGLKEDICDMVLDGPVDQRPSNELAPFGSSFVRGMAGNALDKRVTPETLVSLGQEASGQAATTEAASRQLASTRMGSTPEATKQLASSQVATKQFASAQLPSSQATLGQAEAAPAQAPSAPATLVPRPEDVRIVWAFFTSPTEFSVDLKTANAVEPVRIEMELHDMKWQVRRVHLPNELLAHAGPGT